MKKTRSNCPINYSLEIFGDRWSLLVLRDLVFNNKRTYGDFLSSSEGIATNVLASRLAMLETSGLINKYHSTENRKVFYYSLTQHGIELIPVLVELVLWGASNGPKNKDLSKWAASIKKDKPATIKRLIRDAESKNSYK